MVDRELRDQYAECLERLGDRFESLPWLAPPSRNKDRGVSQVIEFLAGLVNDSSDQAPVQPQEPYSVKLQRTIAFLRSDLEYEWPDTIDHDKPVPFPVPTGIVCALAGGIFFAVAAWAPAFREIAVIINMLLLFLLVKAMTCEHLKLPWEDPECWQQYRDSGDFDVWPFFRQSDYERVVFPKVIP